MVTVVSINRGVKEKNSAQSSQYGDFYFPLLSSLSVLGKEAGCYVFLLHLI